MEVIKAIITAISDERKRTRREAYEDAARIVREPWICEYSDLADFISNAIRARLAELEANDE